MKIFGFGGRKHLPASKYNPAFPYVGKFKVSLPKELSRKEFFIERQQPGGADRECPKFDRPTFMKDLERVFLESNEIRDVQWIANEMFSHYFWPPSSIGIFYRSRKNEHLQAIEAPLEGVGQITADDLGLEAKNSLTAHIIKDNRATYIPDTRFEDYLHIDQILEVSNNENEPIDAAWKLKGVSIEISKTGWDISSIIKKIGPHSRCLFMMPFQVGNEKTGFLAVGYGRLLWERRSYLPIEETFDQYRLGYYLNMALAKFVIHSNY